MCLFSCSSPENEMDPTPVQPSTREYTLTVSSGTGGTVSTSGGTYEEGSTVNVTATPNSEYIFQNWSNGSTDNPLTVTVNQNITLTANFIKRKYPLTVNVQGEGTVREEIVSTGKSTPTEYNSGTTVLLTAVPNDGWEFSSWSGDVESSNSTITTLINEPKNINLTFSQIIPPSITSSLKSKMFTKGVQDTISIGLNIPKGFRSVNVSSELGNISVFSSPEEGSTNGELVLEYTNQSVENVLWDRTIAGHDTIEIVLTDNSQRETRLVYDLRTQPEPVFNEINVDSRVSMNYYPNRLHIQRIRYDNQIDNAYFDPCVPGDEIEREFNRWGNLSDNVQYPLFTDINGDGYFDIILDAIYNPGGMELYQEEDGYLEMYLYEDGKYIYSNILDEHRYVGAFKILPGDFDNDGDVDLYILNSGLDKDPFPGDYSVILENDINNQLFTEHVIGKQHFTHGASLVDIDQDGDLDIYESGMGNENFSGFYINNGNFQFEEQNNFITNSNIWNSTFLTSEFGDIDNDGNIDKIGSYTEFSQCPEYLPDGIESCPNFNPIVFWGYDNNSLSFQNISFIPKVEGYGIPLDIFIYDLDDDDSNEIIISRKGGDSFSDPNYYKDVYIQICKIDSNRIVTDVTNDFIDNYTITDRTCDIPFPQPTNLYDLDGDGLIDLYGRSTLFDGMESRWEWNGSRFIRLSP